MSDFYFLSPTNPNDTTGGGGCLGTGAGKGEECVGPWIVFFRVSTEHDASPHAALCTYHRDLVEATWRDEEPLAAGDELPRSPDPLVSRGIISA